jgi:RHS repeat-associated protein
MGTGYGAGRRGLGVLRAWSWALSAACAAVLLSMALVCPAGALAKGAVLESSGVRAELSQTLQRPGPVVVSAGGRGAPGAPVGRMVASSAFADTWYAPGRPAVTRVYGAPVNFRTADGRWQPIDKDFVAGLGGFENAAGPFTLRVPESLTAGVSVSEQGRSVSFTLMGAGTSPPAVEGNVARFGRVLAGTDLTYVSEDNGVEELATLTGASAPTRLSYQLSLSSGLSPRRVGDGSLELVDGQGTVWFVLPVPFAFPAGAGVGAGRRLPVSVSRFGSGWVMTVDTGQAWVRRALRRGSVVVDPSVEQKSTIGCTVKEETAKTSYCLGENLLVGSDATHKQNHALLYFPLSGIPSASVILDAKLGVKLAAHSTSNAEAVGVYRVTKKWTNGVQIETKPTWEEYAKEQKWSTPGGDYATPAHNSDASVNPSVGTSNGWQYWYPTRLVQEWVNGPTVPEQAVANKEDKEEEPYKEGQENLGLIIKDEHDSEAPANLLEFESPGHTAPYLEVAYAPRGTGEESEYTIISTPVTSRANMGVNVASGDLIVQGNDMSMPGIAELGFTSLRTWNGLETGEVENTFEGTGAWTEANNSENKLTVFSDGSVALQGASGEWIPFTHQSNKSFVTPRGSKAYMCETGSPKSEFALCPETLPSGTKYRLIYAASGNYINYNAEGVGTGLTNRWGDTIKLEHPSKTKAVYTDTHSHKIEETFNEGGAVTEVKDVSGGRATKYGYYSPEGHILETFTDAAGHQTKYKYNPNMTKLTDPDGHVIEFEYDTQHRVTKIIRIEKTEHPKEGATTTFTYYEGTSVPTACGGTAKATVVKDPDWTKEKEHETLYCSNVLDEVEKVFDALGNETKITHDQYANPTATTAPARETGAARGVISLVYSAGGWDQLCEISGLSKQVETCPTTAETEGYSTNAAYKDTTFPFQASREQAAREPEGKRQTTYLCYSAGSGPCEGETSTPEKEVGGAVRRETDPFKIAKQNTQNAEYESNGNIKSSTSVDGHETTYKYNVTTGYLEEVKPPKGAGLGIEKIEPDADGRPHVIEQCREEGACASPYKETLTYNALDQVTEAVYTGPGTTKTFKYTYDADGNLEKREDPTGTTKVIYDKLNRPTEETLPSSAKNVYGYDEASNLTSFTDSGGTTEYLYNGLNELKAMAEPGGNCGKEPAKCTTFTHDNDGSLTKITFPSGATLNYTLEPKTGLPVEISAKNHENKVVLANTYEYMEGIKIKNEKGEEEEEHRATPLIETDKYTGPSGSADTLYDYDELDRLGEALTSSSSEALKACYLYYYNGEQRTETQGGPKSEACTEKTKWYDYNEGNQLNCRVKEVTEKCAEKGEVDEYHYEAAGNETRSKLEKEPETTFSYNNVQQLEHLTPPGKAEETLKYLGSGQSNLTALGTKTLQNSALGLTQQTTESKTSYYAHTPEGLLIDERLPGGEDYNPIYDAQGDVIGLLNSKGELAQTITYGPFGENPTVTEILKGAGYKTEIDVFMFQGGYHTEEGGVEKGEGDAPNGLYHFGERYYEPTTGRWTQPDPEGEEGYTFAGDDPVNARDPSGENYQYWLTVSQAVDLRIVLEGGAEATELADKLGPVVGLLGQIAAIYIEEYVIPALDLATTYSEDRNKKRKKKERVWGVTISVHTILGGHHHDIPDGIVDFYPREEGDAPKV